MFDISTHDLSAVFWNRLLRLRAWDITNTVFLMLDVGQECEAHRDTMEYQTGSIPLSTAVWLNLLTTHLLPKRVFEVGTFIGKSTTAMANAMSEGTMVTCDASNDFFLKPFENIELVGNPKTTSTAALAKQTEPFDLFFFDGRVLPEDVAHIRRLSHERTIYAFDDFEGCEKGVANAAILSTKDYRLIYPPDPELLKPFGVVDRSTLALLVPTAMFRMTAQ